LNGFTRIIVRAELEYDDAVDIIRAVPGHDNDRHVRAGANIPEEIQAVILTKPKVEHNQSRDQCFRDAGSFRTAGSRPLPEPCALSRNRVSICRSDGSSSTTMTWPALSFMGNKTAKSNLYKWNPALQLNGAQQALASERNSFKWP
jgi:hypothetical protein